ncbi:MAG: hypothetical protein IIA14_14495 [SAR324 cluster bacterium]|nr:hypothetical protein [SAR324 cluster bacterium]
MKRPLWLVLAAALALVWASPLFAQQPQPQLVDSLAEYQQRLEKLITERLNSVIPSRNFIVRILILGKPVEVPAFKPSERVIRELPGFRRPTAEPDRTIEKFQIDQTTVRIVINEDIAEVDQEYIRSFVSTLGNFNEERGDRVQLQVFPPPKLDPETGAPVEEPFKLELRDWILVGVLAFIALLLLVVLLRVLIVPRARPPAEAYQPAFPPAAAAAGAVTGRPGAAPGAADDRRLEEEEALREQEQKLASLKNTVVKGLFARGEMGRQLIQSWQDKPDKVGGLIYGLGPTIARQALLPHLDRERYQSLEESMRKDKPPTLETQLELFRECSLFLLAQDLAHPEEVRPNPFAFLEKLSWGQVGHLINDEPVRVKALVLSRIPPGDTARILESLPQDMQLEIAVQIGNLQALPLDMAENVAHDLAVKTRNLPDSKTVDIQGPQTLVDLMGRTSSVTSQYLLKAMKGKDVKLSEEVEKRFFMFEALPLVPQELLPQVVRMMPSQTVIQALQGADQEIQRKVILAFPEQARTGLVTTLRSSQFDDETVLEARRQMVRRFQELADQGKIDLKQISDAWQAQAKAS